MSAVESEKAAERQGFAASLVALLPEFAASARTDDVALRLADTLACAMAAESLKRGGENAVGRAARYAAQEGAGKREATVWATGEKIAVDEAAFRNAVSARYLDFNDTYVGRAIIHPSDVIAALVALAESRAIAWSRLTEAVNVAYEVLCRMAEQADLRAHGCDASTLTPLGTVAGCSWLLGLSPRQSANAIKLAALDSATLRCIRIGRISDWKAAASGRGAVKGLFAVRMAELGTEAPATTFEADDGFFAQVSGKLALDCTSPSRLPETLIKRFSVQIFCQSMLSMAQDLARQTAGRTDAIRRVTISTFKRAVEMVGPRSLGGHALNRETADHSASFCVAAMLVHGRLGYSDFETFLSDRKVLALMDKIDVVDGGDSKRGFP
ncbi:MAG TPA: MmgE/PrpD family protein, partial [Beijerinckiaceae bacterium]|nr:MmgE/PrpD family protein [Beijerinckiaceae bacterium]